MVDFLRELLIFNPELRPSAKACLKNSMFDVIRKENLEEDADIKVSLGLDEMDVFDYEECIDNLPIE